jgi:hypothetical protein
LGRAPVTSRRALASLRRSEPAAAAAGTRLVSVCDGVWLDLAPTTGSCPAAVRASLPRDARSPVARRLTTAIGN